MISRIRSRRCTLILGYLNSRTTDVETEAFQANVIEQLFAPSPDQVCVISVTLVHPQKSVNKRSSVDSRCVAGVCCWCLSTNVSMPVKPELFTNNTALNETQQ